LTVGTPEGIEVGLFVGVRVGRRLTAAVGLTDEEVGLLVVGVAGQVPNSLVSDPANDPPEATVIPSTRTVYEPAPYAQHMPSLYVSVIINLYWPNGRHSVTEDKVLGWL
jgi:hypothetical protein